MNFDITKTRKRGFGMLETVLTVGASLAFAAVAGYLLTQVNAGMKTTDTVRQVTSISSEVQSIYSTSPAFAEEGDGEGAASNDLTAAVREATALPDSYLNENTTTITGDGQTFIVEISDLRDNICERASRADLGGSYSQECTPDGETGNSTLAVVYGR